MVDDSRRGGDSALPSPSMPRSRETVDYLRAMLQELAAIARAEKLDMLAYLISMAQAEAADVAARSAARTRSDKDG